MEQWEQGARTERVRRIVLKGNNKTRAATLLAALETRPGDVYREDRAARLERDLGAGGEDQQGDQR